MGPAGESGARTERWERPLHGQRGRVAFAPQSGVFCCGKVGDPCQIGRGNRAGFCSAGSRDGFFVEEARCSRAEPSGGSEPPPAQPGREFSTECQPVPIDRSADPPLCVHTAVCNTGHRKQLSGACG